MTTSLTLHAMDEELATALRARAAEIGKSLNLTAQELLASALGLFSSRHPANDMSDCFGLLESSSADEMLAAVREQDVIDEAMWK